MGYVPSWARDNYCKTDKYADGGGPELPDLGEPMEERPSTTMQPYANVNPDTKIPMGGVNVQHDIGNGTKLSLDLGGGANSYRDGKKGNVSEMNRFHRLGVSQDIGGDREIGVGVSGYGYSGEREGQRWSGGNDLSSGDIRYREGNTELGASYTPENKAVRLTFRKRF